MEGQKWKRTCRVEGEKIGAKKKIKHKRQQKLEKNETKQKKKTC